MKPDTNADCASILESIAEMRSTVSLIRISCERVGLIPSLPEMVAAAATKMRYSGPDLREILAKDASPYLKMTRFKEIANAQPQELQNVLEKWGDQVLRNPIHRELSLIATSLAHIQMHLEAATRHEE